jgi:hypothetical protein
MPGAVRPLHRTGWPASTCCETSEPRGGTSRIFSQPIAMTRSYSPAATAIAAFCTAATDDAPPMCTVALYATDGMPRFAASSSLEVYPGGGMMPSTSPGSSPASAIASVAACSINSTGNAPAPRM